MASRIHDGANASFGVLMTIPAFEDCRRFVISNPLTAALCLLWPLYFQPRWRVVAIQLRRCGLCRRRYLRGEYLVGDVKLLKAAVLRAGSSALTTL